MLRKGVLEEGNDVTSIFNADNPSKFRRSDNLEGFLTCCNKQYKQKSRPCLFLFVFEKEWFLLVGRGRKFSFSSFYFFQFLVKS